MPSDEMRLKHKGVRNKIVYAPVNELLNILPFHSALIDNTQRSIFLEVIISEILAWKWENAELANPSLRK